MKSKAMERQQEEMRRGVDEKEKHDKKENKKDKNCLLYTSPSPRDQRGSRMPSSA